MRILKYYILLILWAIPLLGVAQQRMSNQSNRSSQNQSDSKSSDPDEDPCIDIDDQRYAWTMDPVTGIMHPCVPDTAYAGLAHKQTMAGRSLGLLYTGNLFSPHKITNFFDQREDHDYLFVNAYHLFAFRPEEMVYYNTKLPYTAAYYGTSGSSVQSNDHLKIDFAGNINKRLGIGTFLDYVYARGEYISQATKPLNWNSYLYYHGDRYKATLTYNLSKLANQENGGISNRDYVLDPDQYTNMYTEPRTMPVNLSDSWNDMDAYDVHLNHNYDLGFWREVKDSLGQPVLDADSLIEEQFVSVASIFHSVDIQGYKHKFRMDANADQTDQKNYYANHFINNKLTLDTTAYSSLTTYAGIRLNEGFNRYSQFGLSAFIGYNRQEYTFMQDTLDLDYITRRHVSNNIFIGVQMSRHLSNRLTFDVTFKLGLLGDKQGDIDLSGQLQTVIPAGKDSIIIAGHGYMRNQHVSYMMNHYFSNHFRWNEDFSSEKKVRLEGNLLYSLTGTEAKVGVEHISNYHYFDSKDFLPHEYDQQIEIVSAEITQRLKWKGLHFDNTLLVQTSTHDDVLPLPKFVWQSDLNLQFCIAHALTTQLGVTGQYATKYYAPTYQPATQQFAVQRDIECGGFPLVNAYINCNLKRIKFYIMYSGLGTNFFSNDAFIMPYYPLQSTRLEYGVTVDLQD